MTRLISYLLFAVLAGCFGGGNYAPLVDRQERISVVPSTHRVRLGETVYSIAWRYNIDFRKLAHANNIGGSYTIYPGQILRLKNLEQPANKSVSSNAKSAAVSPKRPSPTTVSSSRKSTGLASKNSAPSTSETLLGGNPYRWQWPVSGKIIRSYGASSESHKGIDLRGKLGEPVHAANSGKVVYAGNGLVGYGNLLIVKHDQHYLSAYGHNRKILVKEGELVRVGQKIAELGDSGTDTAKLHFEIRKDGKPIDPQRLLPKK